ncbi:unnamed protein product, partial [Ranitomeya imitator]
MTILEISMIDWLMRQIQMSLVATYWFELQIEVLEMKIKRFIAVSHMEDECLKFFLHQYFEVGIIHLDRLQFTTITHQLKWAKMRKIQENRCTKFYHLEEGSKLLGKICKGDVCRCAEENCFMQQQLEEVMRSCS